MTSKWETVKLGEVATQFVDRFTVDPSETYVNLGVKWYAQGVFAREPKTGEEIKATRLFRVKPGQFIYNRMFATEGSFSLVPSDLSHGVVSNEFPVFDLDLSRVIPEYLALHFKQKHVWEYVSQECVGTTKSRSRWKEERFLAYQIELPPLPEQRRIVDLIGVLDDAIEAAEEQVESTINLGDGLAGSAFESAVGDPDIQTLKQVVGEKGLIQTGPFGSQLHKHDYQDQGIPVVMPTNIIDSRVNVQGIARISHEMAETLNKHLLKPGDIVWSRRGDVTRFAQVTEEDEDMICGTGCLLVRPESAEIASWLTVWFSSKNMQNLIQDRAVGATMKNLNTKILGDLPVVLPTNGNELAGALRAVGENMIFYKKHVQSLRSLRTELLTALLSGAHEIPESYDSVMELAGA